MTSTLISSLNKVRWSTSSGSSALFLNAGITHGFCGVNSDHPTDIHHGLQVHGTNILLASDSTQNASPHRESGDVLISKTSGQAIGVKTADCLPILISSPMRSLGLAVHAGWRGLTKGILGEAVLRALEEGASTHELIAAIGPSISRERFEVGFEVVEAIYAMGLTAEGAGLSCSKGIGDRWHVDLSLAAAISLINQGLSPKNIEVMQACTMSSPNVWHSFRREGKGCGSNWTWMRLPT